MRGEKILKNAAFYSLAVLLILVLFFVAARLQKKNALAQPLDEQQSQEAEPFDFVTEIPEITKSAAISDLQEEDAQRPIGGNYDVRGEWEVWDVLFGAEGYEMAENLYHRCLVVVKPKDKTYVMHYSENQPAYQLVMNFTDTSFTGEATDEQVITENEILRVVENACYIGTPELIFTEEGVKNLYSDPVISIEYARQQSFQSTVTLTMNQCYEYEFFETEEYYIFNMYRPQEIYDRILVIDAGHGGNDPGTSGTDGTKTYYEENVNLGIVLKLKEYLDADTTIQTYYTRITDVKPSLAERVNYVNGLEADLLVCIHANWNGDSSVRGAESLINYAQGQGKVINSVTFSQICLEKINQKVNLRNRGLGERLDLALVRRPNMATAYLEMGYMSNPSDLAILTSPEKQKLIAEAIYEAILEAFQMKEAAGE